MGQQITKRTNSFTISCGHKTVVPREPCYTFAEIAERLGIAHGKLVSLCAHHPGLTPVPGIRASKLNSNGRYYHLSAARRWYAAIKDAS